MRGLHRRASIGLGDGFGHGATVEPLLGDCLAHFAFAEVPAFLADCHAFIQRELVHGVVLGCLLDELADPRLRHTQLPGDVPLRDAVDVHFPGTIAFDFRFFSLRNRCSHVVNNSDLLQFYKALQGKESSPCVLKVS